MLKWALTLAVLGSLAAAGAWYPIHGRTVLDRWRTASGPVQFAERSVAEIRRGLGFGPTPAKPARSRSPAAPRPARPKVAQRQAAQPARPTESHTEEDRAALDRLLTERAQR